MINDLAGLPGIGSATAAALRHLVTLGYAEREVVAAFLWLLLDESGDGALDRRTRRLILQFRRETAVPDALRQIVRQTLAGLLSPAGIAQLMSARAEQAP